MYSSFSGNYLEMSDRLNLVPRKLFPVYVKAFQDETEPGAYRCYTKEEVQRFLKTHTCGYGSCGCL